MKPFFKKIFFQKSRVILFFYKFKNAKITNFFDFLTLCVRVTGTGIDKKNNYCKTYD